MFFAKHLVINRSLLFHMVDCWTDHLFGNSLFLFFHFLGGRSRGNQRGLAVRLDGVFVIVAFQFNETKDTSSFEFIPIPRSVTRKVHCRLEGQNERKF
jgi:hypothetical protein